MEQGVYTSLDGQDNCVDHLRHLETPAVATGAWAEDTPGCEPKKSLGDSRSIFCITERHPDEMREARLPPKRCRQFGTKPGSSFKVIQVGFVGPSNFCVTRYHGNCCAGLARLRPYRAGPSCQHGHSIDRRPRRFPPIAGLDLGHR